MTELIDEQMDKSGLNSSNNKKIEIPDSKDVHEQNNFDNKLKNTDNFSLGISSNEVINKNIAKESFPPLKSKNINVKMLSIFYGGSGVCSLGHSLQFLFNKYVSIYII